METLSTEPRDGTREPDAWAKEAARLPIAFSQVREDPRIDEALIREARPNAKVLMIASGGDTAALLAATGRVAELHLVDINVAQLALTDFKLRLLETATPAARLAALGHAANANADGQGTLQRFIQHRGYPSDIFGPTDFVASVGPEHAGRYEVLFQQLRSRLQDFRSELEALLELDDVAEQSRRVAAETPLGQALDRAFDDVMRLENLVCLFGEGATRNAQRSFSSHFAARLRHVLGTLPARGNPFLAQLLLGSFRHSVSYDWFARARAAQMPEVQMKCATALSALSAAEPDSFDLVHLSNILDWLNGTEAAETLALTFRALRPGGLTVIRQLNSTLEIRDAGPRFIWRDEQAKAWLQQDRSFFYRDLFIGMKPGPS
jgi:S-adenosylmethionine-diacylglycerol 3-amino-3-carboxypropyl transferase